MIKNTTGSSETTRKTTFDFSKFKEKAPSHLRKSQISSNFLEWFVGLSEGDGSFIVSQDRLFFIINQKEEKVLANIRTQLGFGKVSRYESHSRFIVADREGILRLLLLFNGNLVLEKTNKRFELWINSWKKRCEKHEIINHLPPKELLFFHNNAWLSGFIDANGCFNVHRSVNSRYSLGWRLRLRFIIGQKSEKDVLQKIKDWLNSGVISNIPQTADMYRFTSTHIASHNLIISYLQQYPLQTIKHVEFLRFASLSRYIKNRKDVPWEGKVLNKIENLINRLNMCQN